MILWRLPFFRTHPTKVNKKVSTLLVQNYSLSSQDCRWQIIKHCCWKIKKPPYSVLPTIIIFQIWNTITNSSIGNTVCRKVVLHLWPSVYSNSIFSSTPLKLSTLHSTIKRRFGRRRSFMNQLTSRQAKEDQDKYLSCSALGCNEKWWMRSR